MSIFFDFRVIISFHYISNVIAYWQRLYKICAFLIIFWIFFHSFRSFKILVLKRSSNNDNFIFIFHFLIFHHCLKQLFKILFLLIHYILFFAEIYWNKEILFRTNRYKSLSFQSFHFFLFSFLILFYLFIFFRFLRSNPLLYMLFLYIKLIFSAFFLPFFNFLRFFLSTLFLFFAAFFTQIIYTRFLLWILIWLLPLSQKSDGLLINVDLLEVFSKKIVFVDNYQLIRSILFIFE